MRFASAFFIVFFLSSFAKAESFKSEYTASMFGLTVTKSTFTTNFYHNSYALYGTLKSAGLGEFFDDTKGVMSASGVIGKNAIIPTSYAVNYVTGKTKKNTRLAFSKGNVVSVSNTPPLKKRQPWVEVMPAHLKLVFDPLSVFMRKAPSLETVCDTPLRIFDGELRMNLNLSPIGMTKIKTNGFEGVGMTCAIRFEPVAGYRSGKKQIDYLRKNKNMSITFVPIGKTGLFAPALAKIGTQIGTITVRAKRFESSGG
jgi:Protein of unknown function (DUF3108)